MRIRVPGLWRHPESTVYWFRMGVPKRLRAYVGKSEIRMSLDERCVQAAAVKAALKRAETLKYFRELEWEHGLGIGRRAEKIVRDGFDALARRHADFKAGDADLAQALDHVTHTMLRMLAFRARLDWGGEHAADAQIENMGEVDAPFPLSPPRAGPVLLGEAFRTSAAANIALFERNGPFRGAAYREIARSLLAACDWQAVDFEVAIVAEAVGDHVGRSGPMYDAVARRILTRLSDHRFGHWPTSVDLVIAPMAQALASTIVEVGPPPKVISRLEDDDAPTTLSKAFTVWKAARSTKDVEKIDDEFKLAIKRFKEIVGTEEVRAVTKKQVKAFRDVIARLPSRPKRAIGALSLRAQAEVAEREGLLTLAPPTVGKQVMAIKVLLGVAVEEEVITVNPAQGVTVEGAKHTGTERDHFSDAEMKLIYESPLMTDPDACSDTMFWIIFAAPFHGARPGEMCKLKPRDTVKDDGAWVMRFREDKRVASASAGNERARRQKTDESVRDLPVHWIVEEGGFVEFARHQAEVGAAWLFDDLTPDKYGDRYKYLSRAINASLRKLGITDADKSFYSSRHSSKREGRRQRIAEQNLDQGFGHASLNTGR
uniref:DUF6538 domain-containing protein n=1 Tax=Sphingomonas sp. TaxID=28214 RepID=UPI00344CDD2B